MRSFDYTINIHGAVIVPLRDRLSTASLSHREIDMQINDLKADLDRVASAMKIAVTEQTKRPLGLEVKRDA